MEELVRKFTSGEDLVMDFCFGTCPMARACILRDQHRRFVGCDLDSEPLSATELDPPLAFPSQALSPNSDITKDEEVRALTEDSDKRRRWFRLAEEQQRERCHLGWTPRK